MAARIRKGDNVIVLAGKDKGKKGSVLRVVADGERVLVQGVNMVKRHTRPSMQNPGGIVEKEASIHLSNVLPICGRCNKPTRVGTPRLEDGHAVRTCRRCGEQLDQA